MPVLWSRAARDIWWIFLVILVADTVLVSLNIARSAQNESWVNHSLAVLNDLNGLHNSLIDAETGARGFVITGGEEYLKSFHDSLPDASRALAELRQITSDNSGQQERLSAVSSLIEQRVKLLDDLVAQRRANPRLPDREAALVGSGQQVMTQIRQHFSALESEEEQLLRGRRALAKSAFTTSIFSAIVGGALTIGMLILANYLMRREDDVRRRGEESLRQSEERFRLIADSLPQFVWVAQPDGHFQYCNQRWRDYIGLASNQTLGYGWDGPLHPDDRQPFAKLWKQALATGQAFETESRFQRPSGESRWFFVRVMPLRGRRDAVFSWLGTATDIDDRKRASEDLEARVQQRTAELQRVIADLYTEASERERATEQLHVTAKELERSNQELEQFAYLASHDLQEPLRKIQSFSDRLQTKFAGQISEQGREYIDRMQSAATRMRRLIDDLLAYSRVATRPQPLVEVDLNSIVREVLGDLEDSIERTGATFDIGPLPTIEADALQMRQMMQNLLSNALKFHRPDVPPKVSVHSATLARMPNDRPEGAARMGVRIDVSDNGIGFEDVYRDRVFDVFQRLHSRQEYEGTGIGLAVVRKIAERHGGMVAAHGVLGQGATFSVFLPVGTNAKSPPPSGQSVTAPAISL